MQISEIQEHIDELEFMYLAMWHWIENITFLDFMPSGLFYLLTGCTSEISLPITLLFVNENIMCGYLFSKNIRNN